MRERGRATKEMTIAVGVAAGVIAIGFMVLLVADPWLRRPRDNYATCVLDRELVFDRSAIGQSAILQFSQIKQRYQDALTSEKRLIDSAPAHGGTDTRLSTLLQRVQLENARLEKLRARAHALVIEAVAPTIRKQSVISRCSIIVDTSAIVDLGRARDITPALIKAIGENVPQLPSGTLEKMLPNLP
jgi:hypothetical protein